MPKARSLVAIISCVLISCAPSVAIAQPAQPPVTTLNTTPAQHGSQLVSLVSATPGAAIYYTTNGAQPTAQSTPYRAPFLVASHLTVKAVTLVDGKRGAVISQTFAPSIPANTLVWSDEFVTTTGTHSAPDPKIWTYDTGNDGFGNHELETYCAWGAAAAPCDPANPNAFVAPDGYLHIVARQTAPGTYTSARLKSQGLFSVDHGSSGVRVEARMKLPLGQGIWPAFWTLGNTIATVEWPACGEQDIMEHIDAPHPDWIAGSLHGTHGDTTQHYPVQHYPVPPNNSFSAGDWHTYGMLWSKGKIAFYVDSPANIYTTVTAVEFSKQPGAVWPFDSGTGVYLLLNLAVGGDWPKSPDATTTFPSEVLVDYVRVYTQ